MNQQSLSKEVLKDRVVEDFKYHGEGSPRHYDHHLQIHEEFMSLALALIDLTPLGREQSIMLTTLEESLHWAQQAVSKTGEEQL